MAICKIWDVQERPIEAVLQYIIDKNKTTLIKETETMHGESVRTIKRLCGAINTEWWSEAKDMKRTKEVWQNKSKKVCYHAVQSWMPGEIEPELAHKIGMEFAKRMWGDRFEVVIATHMNTGRIHNHFVINNISFLDGKQYYDNKKNYRRMKKISDDLCREHGLSVIGTGEYGGSTWKVRENDKLAESEHKDMLLECDRPITRKDMARAAIDKALEKSVSLKDFACELGKMGYEVDLNPNHKYWTIKAAEWNHCIRMYRLGKIYDNEQIVKRLSEQTVFSGNNTIETQRGKQMNTAPKVTRVSVPKRTASQLGTRKPCWKRRSKKALYLRYSFVLGVIPKNVNRRKYILYTPELRDALRKLDRISFKTKLLVKYDIRTERDLKQTKYAINDKMETLLYKRKYLYRHYDDSDERKAELSEISRQLKQAKKEIAYLDEIREESTRVEEQLKKYKESGGYEKSGGEASVEAKGKEDSKEKNKQQ